MVNTVRSNLGSTSMIETALRKNLETGSLSSQRRPLARSPAATNTTGLNPLKVAAATFSIGPCSPVRMHTVHRRGVHAAYGETHMVRPLSQLQCGVLSWPPTPEPSAVACCVISWPPSQEPSAVVCCVLSRPPTPEPSAVACCVLSWPPTPSGLQRGAPLTRQTLSVLTTFPILYAICMRNHRIIIGNVAEGPVTEPSAVACCVLSWPLTPHYFAHIYHFNNISNIVRYL